MDDQIVLISLGCGYLTWDFAVLAGFLTGGSLAIRGGFKAARNSAIMCGIFLAVIEGVGIGFQRMMADNTKLEVRLTLCCLLCVLFKLTSLFLQ